VHGERLVVELLADHAELGLGQLRTDEPRLDTTEEEEDQAVQKYMIPIFL
jgi:hypothetical protein